MSLLVLLIIWENILWKQEHVPEQDEFASKLVWEERLNFVTESEVAM